MPSRVPMSFLLERFLALEPRSSREEAEGSKAGAMRLRFEVEGSADLDSLAGVLPIVL